MVYNAREVGLQPNVYLDDAQSWNLLVRAIDRFAETGFQQVLPVYVLDREAMRSSLRCRPGEEHHIHQN